MATTVTDDKVRVEFRCFGLLLLLGVFRFCWLRDRWLFYNRLSAFGACRSSETDHLSTIWASYHPAIGRSIWFGTSRFFKFLLQCQEPRITRLDSEQSVDIIPCLVIVTLLHRSHSLTMHQVGNGIIAFRPNRGATFGTGFGLVRNHISTIIAFYQCHIAIVLYG